MVDETDSKYHTMSDLNLSHPGSGGQGCVVLVYFVRSSVESRYLPSVLLTLRPASLNLGDSLPDLTCQKCGVREFWT